MKLDEKTYKQLVRRIHHEDPNDKIFDEAQLKVSGSGGVGGRERETETKRDTG